MMVGQDRAQRIALLVEELLERAAEVPATELHRQPAPEEWSVMRVLAHVAEFLPYWAQQSRQVAARAENDQAFGRTHDNAERIAAVEAHAHALPEQVVPRIRSALAEAAAIVRAIPMEGWTRTGRHARRGEMTVTEIIDQFLVEHLEEHGRQASTALAELGRHDAT